MSDITLDTFINTIFPNIPEDARVCLCEARDKGFHNRGATAAFMRTFEPGTAPWYFCVSTAKAVPRGSFLRRGRDDLLKAYCLVLDDIGTKADEPPVEPSWKLESSEGNYQWGYILDPVDLMDEKLEAWFEGCVKAMTDANYGDPGAGGSYRVVRVPGSLNPKKNNFVSRITSWEPDRFWALEELMTQMDLTPVDMRERKRGSSGGGGVPADLGALADPTLDWLVAQGMTTGVADGKFVEIICPWAAEHSSGSNTAGYTPVGYDRKEFDGAFSCHHDHCKAAGRGKQMFASWVQSQRKSAVFGPSLGAVWPGWPTVFPSYLPDVIGSEKTGGPAPIQKATSANIQYAVEAMGISVRSNMMAHEDDLSADGFEGSHKAVRLVVNDTLLRCGMPLTGQVDLTLEVMGEEGGYNPTEDWILSHEWDGVDHISELAATVVTDNPLWGVYLRKWLIQTVAACRGWRDGLQQLPHVLVFSGAHGLGKSHWFKSLLPVEFFKGEASLQLGSGSADKDLRLAALRATITELAELETTFSKSDIGAMKAFLSTEQDEIRRAYGRGARLMPRTTSFCGSVNSHEFLVDRTGNRRFWPVSVTRITWEHSVSFAGVWAQANAAWEAGESFFLDGSDLEAHDELSAEHMSSSPIQDAFDEYFTEAIMNVDKALWKPLNTTRVFELLGVKHLATHGAHKAEMAGLLNTHFGPHKMIRGRQKVRLMPMDFDASGMRGHLRPVD